MFSFHKPKIYRSMKGCCICRAKSSSSRFTDSKRYESDFENCFCLYERRSGEICNACVLLVKRWKKLPKEKIRHWAHVVDARAGPGTKSMMKMKSRNIKDTKFKKKHKHKSKFRLAKRLGDDQDALSLCLDGASDHELDPYSPLPSDCSDDEGTSSSSRRKQQRKKSKPMRCSPFLDLTYWKRTQICCGVVFYGANGELLVDINLYPGCKLCQPSMASSKPGSEASSAPGSPDVAEAEAAPLPLTAPATPQDLLDSCTYSEPPVLDRALPLDLHHDEDNSRQVAMSDDHLLASAVLDLSLSSALKNKTNIVPQNSCIAMEV